MANCILCEDHSLLEDGILVWRGDDCRVVMVHDANLPGFCRIIWNRHIKEMTDLSFVERELLMTIVFAVEGSVREVLNPDKVNLASLGNQAPHLHWHVIPRFADDAFFPDSIWSQRVRDTAIGVLEKRRILAMLLPAAIRAAISQLY